jgi:predicted ABC-class ATPase
MSTVNASGSTSQAASILEAIEAGSRLLLIDEDTSATNFMIRDPLMDALLEGHSEPLIPFLTQARTLFEMLGVSTVLVIGGSGEYFRVADRVLVMDHYRPHERTERARKLARERPPLPADDAERARFEESTRSSRLLPRFLPGARDRIKVLGPRQLLVARSALDLGGIEALREVAQARLVAEILSWRERQPESAQASGRAAATATGFAAVLEQAWSARGFRAFGQELIAAINRLRPARSREERCDPPYVGGGIEPRSEGESRGKRRGAGTRHYGHAGRRDE